MIKLSKRQVLMLHAQLIKETGGAEGLRDENLLESTIEAPQYTQSELSSIILEVAAGNKGYEDLLRWILAHEM